MAQEKTNLSPVKRKIGRPRDPDSMLELRRRKLKLEIRRLRLTVAIEERRKVAIEQAATLIAREFGACRARLLAIPPKLAPVVVILDDVEAARAVLTESINEALAELTTDAQKLSA